MENGNFDKNYWKSLLKKAINLSVYWNVILFWIGVSAALFTIGTIGFFVVAAGALGSSKTPDNTSYTTLFGNGTHQLLSIPIKGVITGTDASAGGLFGSGDSQTAGYSVKDELYRAADDASISGIILEIDSPGGTIYGAHAIADGVEYYRKTTHKPVYAHVSGTGASGAYWAAASADQVLVDYGSDVGSVGVIMGPFQYYDKLVAQDSGLLGGGIVTQNGIENVMITAGKSKDVGSPYRRLTADEMATFQKQVNNEYDQFVTFVSERRGIPDAQLRGTIGAMIYDSKSAKELKLSDGTMSRQEAYSALAQAAKVGDDYSVVQEDHGYGLLQSLMMTVTRTQVPKAQSVDLCSLTHATLAYHGDVTSWCEK